MIFKTTEQLNNGVVGGTETPGIALLGGRHPPPSVLADFFLIHLTTNTFFSEKKTRRAQCALKIGPPFRGGLPGRSRSPPQSWLAFLYQRSKLFFPKKNTPCTVCTLNSKSDPFSRGALSGDRDLPLSPAGKKSDWQKWPV